MRKKIAANIGALRLPADLTIPEGAGGVVIFAHGSGSSRLSPRNIHVAERLNEAGFATVLFDLLTEDEAADRVNVFDIPLLSERMSQAVVFAGARSELNRLPIGLFGASTGAAAALLAAAKHGRAIAAVVSRGGRPDLALDHLGQVRAPTLLIVGGFDEPVIEMNRTALAALRCEKRLAIVPGATHLFEEPGKLDQVVALATGWFTRHLVEEQE
jgi:pimeloyl-ACP methyl ester carboxylesterase